MTVHMPASPTKTHTGFIQNIRQTGWVTTCAYMALLALSFSSLYKLSFANTALGLLLSLYLFEWRNSWQLTKHQPWFWLTFTYLIFLLLQGIRVTAQGNPLELATWDETLNYVKVAFLPGLIVGYWLHKKMSLLPVMISLVPAGLAFRIATKYDHDHVLRIISGADRATFGDSAVHFGLWSVAAFGCSIFTIFAGIAGRFGTSKNNRIMSAAYGITAAFFSITCMLFSQTRTAWLIFVLLTPPLLLCATLQTAAAATRRLLLLGLSSLLLFGSLSLVWTHYSDVILDRWHKAQPAVTVALSGDWSEATNDSLGYRLQMYQEGWESWRARPWLGWGAGSDDHLLENSERTPIVDAGFYHFHNDLIIWSAELGTAGAAAYMIIFTLPFFYLIHSIMNQPSCRLEKVTLIFLGGVLLLSSFADNIFTSYRGPFLLAIFTGGALAFRITEWQLRDETAR